MNTEVDKAEALNRARQLIDEGKDNGSEGFLKIGAGLALVSDFGLHKLENLSLAKYIVATGMSVAKGNQALSCYRRFGHLDTKGVLHTRLITLASIKFENDDGKQAAIDEAKILGARDFERFVAEKKGREIPSECAHENQVTICTKCRARIG